MGIGISLHPLASAVAREGALGIVSSACLDRLVSKRNSKKLTTYEAAYEEVSLAKAAGGYAGINIMVALVKDYADSVRGALDAKADVVISGGGLPLNLPSLAPPNGTALMPIVSSPRALELICKKWERLGYRPDGAILEGPLAGGHLGFRSHEVDLESNTLERLFPPVKEVAKKHGDFPVIVAGGLHSHSDIRRFIDLGADGVQLGTRFLATRESSATPDYKNAVVKAQKEDLLIAQRPGSPCGMPFRVIRQSPMFITALKGLRAPRCDKGYLLLKDASGHYGQCSAKENNHDSFCICNGLLSSAGYNPDDEDPLYTAGANAWKIDQILPVRDLMDELTGRTLPKAG
jgi:nitronate monooxygenase